MNAQADQNNILVSLCGGSVEQAEQLYDLARRYQQAKEAGDDETEQQLGTELNDAIAKASGEIFQTLSEAQSAAFERAVLAKATGTRFAGQLKAYRAAPEIFLRRHRLAMLEDTLPGVRKYVVLGEEEDTEVYIIDLQKAQGQTFLT